MNVVQEVSPVWGGCFPDLKRQSLTATFPKIPECSHYAPFDPADGKTHYTVPQSVFFVSPIVQESLKMLLAPVTRNDFISGE